MPKSGYKITWIIDILADNEVEAAREALRIQRDPESEATFFIVHDKDTGDEFDVDLDLSDTNYVSTKK